MLNSLDGDRDGLIGVMEDENANGRLDTGESDPFILTLMMTVFKMGPSVRVIFEPTQCRWTPTVTVPDGLEVNATPPTDPTAPHWW